MLLPCAFTQNKIVAPNPVILQCQPLDLWFHAEFNAYITKKLLFVMECCSPVLLSLSLTCFWMFSSSAQHQMGYDQFFPTNRDKMFTNSPNFIIFLSSIMNFVKTTLLPLWERKETMASLYKIISLSLKGQPLDSEHFSCWYHKEWHS